MLSSHRERLFQVQQQSGLDFIQSLRQQEYAPAPPPPPIHSPAASKVAAMPQIDLNATYQYTTQNGLTSGSNIPSVPCVIGDHVSVGQNLGLDGIDSILDRYGLLQPGDMIDFYGPSCCGKTSYLYAIIISTILPRSWKYSKSKPAILLNGKARSVMFLDLEQGFSVDRLKLLLHLEIFTRIGLYEEQEKAKARKHYNEHDRQDFSNIGNDTVEEHVDDEAATRMGEDSGAEKQWQEDCHVDIRSPEMQAKMDLLVQSCLRNVHVFRPQDAISAIVILRTLDQYIAASTSIGSPSLSIPSPPFAILMIDSLSSFYWQERASNNHNRFIGVLIDALNRLIPRWKLIFVSTTWSLPSKTLATDRTVTDTLRARFRYRFLMQPRTLDRFDSEDNLLREWMTRQRARQQQNHIQLDQGPSVVGKKNTVITNLVEGGNEYTGSMFQAQMIIPSAEYTRQGLFRFSVSDTAGVRSFSVQTQE
ncbi:DNA repair protein xrcc2 [Haplosporangium sp. Z 27]|nr:DNA repair protein xrcc2 [Haplosporangium sp. Z 27]